jgi:uncharacterized Ntn-hydrolase superfamily protein
MPPSMTFSIVARDGESFGVAVASKFLAAGALVPWAAAGAGALATQAFANLSYGPRGLELLSAGASAAEVVSLLTEADDLRAQRQLGVVDARGGAETYTGEECIAWAGGRTGAGYAAQGNILAGSEVVDAMADTFDSSPGDLADRLLAALGAGDRSGGDRRGRQAAGILVVSPAGGYGGTTDVVVDLRIDDHPDPCAELGRLLALHRVYFSKPTAEDLVTIDPALLAEIRSRLSSIGYRVGSADVYDEVTRASLEAFAGWENFEERLVEGALLDRHILEALRARSR